MSEIDAKEIDVASLGEALEDKDNKMKPSPSDVRKDAVSYTHLRAHET